MKSRLFLCGLIAFMFSCSYFPDSLTDRDIEQYINAYENLAKVSPQIDKEKGNEKSISIFTCEKCRVIMEAAVRDSGYASLQSFFLMDLRMSYTMRNVIYLQMSELIGGVSKDIPVENLCGDKNIRGELNDDQKKKVDRFCIQASGFSKYIEKIGGVVENFAKKLMTKGDIDIVGKNFDKIHAAVTNKNLSSELNRAGGKSGWDD